MTETKQFPTPAVFSAITGWLVCPIGEVYEVCSWMAGEDVYTHQLPRIGKEAKTVVLAMHPHLASAFAEANKINRGNWEQWRDTWVDRFGPVIAVPRMTHAEHESIDPISELAEKVHPDRVEIVVMDPQHD